MKSRKPDGYRSLNPNLIASDARALIAFIERAFERSNSDRRIFDDREAGRLCN
jgi:hypothetical protein